MSVTDPTVVQLRRKRSPRQPRELLRVEEAADKLGVDPSTVRRWIRAKTIPFVRLGDGGPRSPVRIPLVAMEEWWRRRQEGGRL